MRRRRLRIGEPDSFKAFSNDYVDTAVLSNAGDCSRKHVQMSRRNTMLISVTLIWNSNMTVFRDQTINDLVIITNITRIGILDAYSIPRQTNEYIRGIMSVARRVQVY
jgi:hypothetical protein